MEEFDIGNIDEVIHGRIRLGVMAYLMVADVADFTALRQKLDTTDGTLSVHLRKLQEAGFVAIKKSFRGNKPLTQISMTHKGQKAFRAYLDAIGRLAAL